MLEPRASEWSSGQCGDRVCTMNREIGAKRISTFQHEYVNRRADYSNRVLRLEECRMSQRTDHRSTERAAPS
jgi:hypothetical protein